LCDNKIMKALLLGIALPLFCASVAHAQPRALAYDLRLDLPLTLTAATLWGAGHLLRDELSSNHCRWCVDNAFDAWAREKLLWSEPDRAGRASDVGALIVMPVLAFGGLAGMAADASAVHYIWQDFLFVIEAVSVAGFANTVVKFAVARERPYVHYDSFAGERTGSSSFYSAHTSRTFALATAAGMVASLRGYRFAPAIWTLGLLIATLVAYARVAGDFHYLSDVLAGAAAGSLFGAGLPWLLHRPRPIPGQLSVSATGVTWTFRH
jgi:membrane-associated phospholipid phosphatase